MARSRGWSRVKLDVGRHDPVAQLDLMARIAGLRLKERWSGWQREPFTAAGRNCISVYTR